MANPHHKEAKETRNAKLEKLGAKEYEEGKAKRIAGLSSSSEITELPPQ